MIENEKNKQKQPHGERHGQLKNGNPPCDLSLLPRCNATAKSTGKRCRQAAMRNGKCYWHGGCSTGAPIGNQNALTHGMYTRESWEYQKAIQDLLGWCSETLEGL